MISNLIQHYIAKDFIHVGHSGIDQIEINGIISQSIRQMSIVIDLKSRVGKGQYLAHSRIK